jgi:hypothetical protein
MVLNLGTSFFIFFGSIFLLPIIKKIGFYVDRKYGEDHPKIRKHYLSFKQKMEYGYFIRLFFEMYLDLAIASFVNLYFFNDSFGSLKLTGNILSAFLAVVGSIIVVVVPLALWYVLLENRSYIEINDF